MLIQSWKAILFHLSYYFKLLSDQIWDSLPRGRNHVFPGSHQESHLVDSRLFLLLGSSLGYSSSVNSQFNQRNKLVVPQSSWASQQSPAWWFSPSSFPVLWVGGGKGKEKAQVILWAYCWWARTFSGQTCQSLATSHQVFVWSSVLKPPILHPDFGSALVLWSRIFSGVSSWGNQSLQSLGIISVWPSLHQRSQAECSLSLVSGFSHQSPLWSHMGFCGLIRDMAVPGLRSVRGWKVNWK